MKKRYFHNLGLKLIALGLAIITWIYVSREVVQSRDNSYQRNHQNQQPVE